MSALLKQIYSCLKEVLRNCKIHLAQLLWLWFHTYKLNSLMIGIDAWHIGSILRVCHRVQQMCRSGKHKCIFVINEARKCVTTKFTYDIIRLMKFNNMCVTIIVHN
jgi:hypothetical protein